MVEDVENPLNYINKIFNYVIIMVSNSQYILNNAYNRQKTFNNSLGIIFLFIIAISLIIYKFSKNAETFVNKKIKKINKKIKKHIKENFIV